MEISSMGTMGSMAGMMGMQGGMMQGAQKNQPPPDASEASSSFIDALDSDGDGALSQTEFSSGESSTESVEEFDTLDTNEDGFVSQAELEADMTSKMNDMKAKLNAGQFSGIQQSSNSEGFAQLMGMMNTGSEGGRDRGMEAYGQMQESMFGGGDYASQASSQGLSIVA